MMATSADSNIQRGRADLRAWEDSKPDNFFTADTNLQHVLQRTLGSGAFIMLEHDLAEFGAACAGPLDAAARQENLIGNHPRLERYTGIGDRTEQIEFHPNHDSAGHVIWKSGILALQEKPGNVVRQMALFYLLGHNGEGGLGCSIAFTAGMIRALQQVGDPDLQARFLPPLLDPGYDTMQHAAQFLTEIQGGSDVGANAVVACDQGDGSWRISGEKWFCSNVNADQFLVMARPEGAPDGTRGLGVFLVPRTLDDGSVNGFRFRRLKEKLGTCTLASAELDFEDAVAYAIGPVDQGFRTTVELVLNTSRLMNAVSCAGLMRRAYIEASTYACHRRAFGAAITSYPLVQEAIADIQAEYYAATASGFALAHLLDRVETGRAGKDDAGTYRLLVNLNKYITSIHGSEAVHRAIEVLGGNGAIETFSVLPRLYRDMVVLESWEGAHNVLCLQALRDCLRYHLHEPYARFVQAHIDSATHDSLHDCRQHIVAAFDRALELLRRLGDADSTFQQAHARRLADALVYSAQAALLLAEANWELAQELPTIKPDVLRHFINRHLRPGYDPLNDTGYLPRLERLMAAQG